jgi:outer membrane protein TolC
MNVVWKAKGRIAALVALLMAILDPGSAAAEVVTLSELEAVALDNKARFEASEAATTQTRAEVGAARALKRPTFWMNITSVVAPGSNIEQVPTVDDRVVNVRASPTVSERTAFRPNVRYEGTIDMRAPLYDGTTRASLRAAEAYHAAARASSSASRETVLTMVRAAYLDWLASYLDVEFARIAAQDAAAQRARIVARVDDGERPPSELDTARYQELQAELAASDAAARLRSARRLLESAVGSELSPNAEPDRELLSMTVDEPEAEESSEVEALELERDAAKEEANAYRKSRVPVLAVVGRTGLAGVNENVFPMYQVGVDLAVPLWDGGRATSLAQAADARALELDVRARDARQEHRDERERALSEHESAVEQLALVESLVAISEKRVGQAQTSYDLGAGDLEAVANARAALREAQSRRVQIQVSRADAILRLHTSASQ